jgi:hypothetical protein
MKIADRVRKRREDMYHGERGSSRLPTTTTGHRVTWFGPDRPVGGGTVALRPATDTVVDVDDTDGPAGTISSETP